MASAKAAKTASAKEKKNPKKQVSDIVAENEQLLQDLTRVQNELTETKQKLSRVLMKLTDCTDRKWKRAHNVTSPAFNPLDLTADTIDGILDRIVAQHEEHKTSAGSRIEELEKQVTQLNLDLLRATKKSHAYEDGLNNLLRCQNIDLVRDQIYQLQVIAGEAQQGFEANDSTQSYRDVLFIDGITQRADSDAQTEMENAYKLHLVAPPIKEAGETLINDMNADLKSYLIQELSLEKASGADWRALARSVGMTQASIEELKEKRLFNVAGHVLDAWVEICPTATVRQLHRHLMSPALRRTILCKRLRDFYDVM